MGLLSYLRGDDVLAGKSETRSLPRPDNELPLAGLPTVWSGPTCWKLAPVEALAIADGWAAVRVLSDAVSSLPFTFTARPNRVANVSHRGSWLICSSARPRVAQKLI